MKTPTESRDDVDRLFRLANPVATENLPDSRSAAAETLYARLLLGAEPRATVRDSPRRAGRPRRLVVAVAVASLLLVTGAALAAVRSQGQASEEPLAFQRAKRPGDVFGFRFHRILDSRRIASYVDPRGRKAELFVAKVGADERFTEEQHCVYLRDSGAGTGGGCSTAGTLLRPGTINLGSSRLLSGITANDVARVVIVG